MPGAITSIFILLLVGIYAIFKAKTLFDRSDYVIQTEKNDGAYKFFEPENWMTSEKGFKIAAGVADASLNIQ